MRSTLAVEAPVGGQQAELWGDEQWKLLKKVVDERNPRVIGIDYSRTFAFSDGLTHGEYLGMTEALGDRWNARLKPAEELPLQFIASRVADEDAFYGEVMQLVWELIGEMYSSKVIVPGKTKTSDLVWWWRQRVNDLGLGTWFQPSIDVQRAGATEESLGSDPIIQRGDVLHCDVGITALGLNTDTQHMAYVLKTGETAAPAGLQKALENGNALQDIVMAEMRPGRSGNEVLAAAGWAVGLSGGRAGARRLEADRQHVVFHRAAGHDAGSRVERTAGADGARGGHDDRDRRHAALGARPAEEALAGEVSE
jgi:hypothetical protein